MKKYDQQRLDVIRPSVFTRRQEVDAWFTLKNSGREPAAGAIPGLNLGIGTSDDAGRVRKNRETVFGQLGIDPDWVAFGQQVHGNRVRYVTEGGTYPETDALITEIPGLALAIQVADCAAILLGDPSSGVAAAVHAGWRGAAGEILPSAIEAMKERGAKPEAIQAYVSPCISQKNFEVGEEVAVQFPDRYVDRNSYRKPHVDLKAFLRGQMTAAGISENNIEIDDRCTMEDREQCYSYRREGERSGRMLGIIQIKR